jgi:hypothetical protein
MDLTIYKIILSYSSFIRVKLATLKISCYLKGTSSFLRRYYHLIELDLRLQVATITLERDFLLKNIIKIELIFKVLTNKIR